MWNLSDPEIYDNLIRGLEKRLEREPIHFDPEAPPGHHYINGFIAACYALGIIRSLFHESSEQSAIEARGWDISTVPLREQMKLKGFSPDQMDREFLEIEVQTWRNMRDALTADGT
jgi:hypothetical protein